MIHPRMHHTSYNCDTMLNNAFGYGPDGKDFFAGINFPGSWMDSSLMACFLHQMKRRIGGIQNMCRSGIPPKWESIWDICWAGDKQGSMMPSL
jgi:hypothetical protein